jgi:hypothetical protein
MQWVKNNRNDGSKKDWRSVWPDQQIAQIKRHRRNGDKE